MGILDAPGYSRTQADAQFGRKNRMLVPIFTRCSHPFVNTGGLSDGVVMGGNARLHVTALADGHGLVLGFPNWYNSGGAETEGPNDITVQATVEVINQKPIKCWFNGQLTATVNTGGTAYTDPLGISYTKGQDIYINIRVTVSTSGYKFPLGYQPVAANGEGKDYNNPAPVERITGYGWPVPASTSTRMYGPCIALGYPTNPNMPVLGMVGDSILSGFSDTGANLDNGWLVRALNNRTPFIRSALVGTTANAWAQTTSPSRFLRQSILERAGMTHIVTGLGINDISSTTLNQTVYNSWLGFKQYGVPVYQTTLTPYTASTDFWTTTANQTVNNAANEARRVAFNDWLRDGAPTLNGVVQTTGATGAGIVRIGQAGHPVTQYWEIADSVETSRNSGIWKAFGRTVSDAAITTGTATLTSATANFTNADVGKLITVAGAGASSGTLYTSITGFTSATTVTVANNAGTTVSAAVTNIGAYGMTTDGIHPSGDSGATLGGHALMANAATPYLNAALGIS